MEEDRIERFRILLNTIREKRKATKKDISFSSFGSEEELNDSLITGYNEQGLPPNSILCESGWSDEGVKYLGRHPAWQVMAQLFRKLHVDAEESPELFFQKTGIPTWRHYGISASYHHRLTVYEGEDCGYFDLYGNEFAAYAETEMNCILVFLDSRRMPFFYRFFAPVIWHSIVLYQLAISWAKYQVDQLPSSIAEDILDWTVSLFNPHYDDPNNRPFYLGMVKDRFLYRTEHPTRIPCILNSGNTANIYAKGPDSDALHQIWRMNDVFRDFKSQLIHKRNKLFAERQTFNEEKYRGFSGLRESVEYHFGTIPLIPGFPLELDKDGAIKSGVTDNQMCGGKNYLFPEGRELSPQEVAEFDTLIEEHRKREWREENGIDEDSESVGFADLSSTEEDAESSVSLPDVEEIKEDTVETPSEAASLNEGLEDSGQEIPKSESVPTGKRISTQTALKFLGITSSTLYRYVSKGLIAKHYDDPGNKKRPYYLESEILEFKKRLPE